MERVCVIYLDEERDKDLIVFLEKQPKGKRSTAFKELARQALRKMNKKSLPSSARR